MKTDFQQFPVGTVFNPINRTVDVSKPQFDTVTVEYPSRLEAMALDPSKIADNNNLIYPAGQIDFAVSVMKHIKVTHKADSIAVTVSPDTSRSPLVRHAALIMQSALHVSDGLHISVDNELDLKHCGLGSSSSLVAGVAAAVNELYGRPLAPLEISRYCAQNHGEEIERTDSELMPVQCIGGSAVSGHFEGGVIVLAGQATPIARHDISEEMKVVIGVPSDFTHPDSKLLMEAEVSNMSGFSEAGKKYGPQIAYRLVHEVLPGLVEGNLKPCKDLIFDYRWDMGSIKNCSFVYPAMIDIAESLRGLRDDNRVEILSLSSVGPGFFALTKYPEYVASRFEEQGMTTHLTSIHNGKYSVSRSNKK